MFQFPEIIITNRRVPSSEAATQVPTDCRMAYLHEVAQSWNASPEFRERLCYLPHLLFAWTNQNGLSSSGPHRITVATRSGIAYTLFEPITEEQFSNLDDKDRSWHYPGSGLVVFSSGGFGRGLAVYAGPWSMGVARVALVRLSPKELVKQASTQQIASQEPVPVDLVAKFRGCAAKLGSVLRRYG